MTKRRFPWRGALTAGSITLGALGLITLLTRRETTRRTPPQPKPLGRVALIGDSYAVGLGPQLDKLLLDFKYEGHVGTSTWEWAARNRKECGQCGDWLTSFRPHIVLVSLGVNDGDAPKLANYQTIVRGLQGLGARVVWIQPPAAVRTPAHAVIASLGVRTVPATTTPLSADRLHPVSYAPWAQEIVQVLRGT